MQTFINNFFSPILWILTHALALCLMAALWTFDQILALYRRIRQGSNGLRSSNQQISSTGKAVFVTGAASGIGRAVCEILLQKGCFVFVADIDEESLEKIYHDKSNVRIIVMDVTQDKSVDEASKIVQNHVTVKKKGLFAIFNAAGIVHESVGARLMDISVAEHQRTMDVNFMGTVRINNALYPFIKRFADRHDDGTQPPVILNVSSISGAIAPKYIGPYACAKGALFRYTDTLCGELSPFGIRVLNIAPGFVDTPLTANLTRRTAVNNLESSAITRVATRRMLAPHDVASTAVQSMFRKDAVGEIYTDRLVMGLFISVMNALPLRVRQRLDDVLHDLGLS